jgi:hypothetical protein
MRPTRTFFRGTLAGAAALVLLTACSGGSSNSASSSSSSTAKTSSSAASSTPAGPTGADAVFCGKVAQLVPQLAALQSAPPAQAPALLQQLVAAFDATQAPAAVQADWQSLGTGLHQLAAAVGGIDVNSQQGQAQLEQLKQQATASAAAAQGNISTWVLSNCSGASASSSSSAAATTS